MKYFYKSKNCFFDEEIEGETCTKVYTDDEYDSLYAGVDLFHYIGIAEGEEYPSVMSFDADTCATIARRKREEICFPVINRGSFWYDGLTDEQQNELRDWYKAWLDVTETFTVPDTPSWLENM